MVQRYVDEPLLLRGFKFDVRWWAVVTSIDPLRAYMLRDGFVKAASSRAYSIADVDVDKCAHVTNNKVQSACGGAPPASDVDLARHVRHAAFARQANASADVLYAGAQRVLKAALAVGLFSMQTRAACARTFQMLALDVVYDAQQTAHLLEVNLNGYLGLGLLAIPGGRAHFTAMLRLVGAAGYERRGYQGEFEARASSATQRGLAWLQDERDERNVLECTPNVLWERVV